MKEYREYIRVDWPESQEWMDEEEAILDVNEPCCYWVPEDLYNERNKQ